MVVFKIFDDAPKQIHAPVLSKMEVEHAYDAQRVDRVPWLNLFDPQGSELWRKVKSSDVVLEVTNSLQKIINSVSVRLQNLPMSVLEHTGSVPSFGGRGEIAD